MVSPDTVWAVGPDASDGGPRGRPGGRGGSVLTRAQWLADRRSDPLAGGLLALVALVAGLCAGYATIVVVLAAAASAPGRARSLATARVLGLRTGTRRGSLPVSCCRRSWWPRWAACCSAWSWSARSWRRSRCGSSPGRRPIPGWCCRGGWCCRSASSAATVLVVVAVESSARRRERLGQVLRVR